ncbi:MAG: AMP-binding protein [Candidatus Sumerlaeota bacterium]|nr:AMP-binding protein [Candidatus Sumerlaeota bacterium]
MYIRNRILDLFRNGRARVFSAAKQEITSAQLLSSFGAIRNYIRDHVPAKGKVAVRLPYDYHQLLCAYACMESERVYIPLEPAWPENRIEQIRLSSRFDLLIDEALLPEILATPFTGPLAPTPSQPDAESILYTIYTSGSTGEPKGVMISRRAYENFLRFLDGYYPEVTHQDRLLMVAKFTFDMSLLDIAMFLIREMSIYFSRSNGDAFRLAYEIEEYGVTWIDTVPNLVVLLLTDGVYSRADLSSLRFLVIGGARFPWKLLEDIKAKLPPPLLVYNAYGPTEATVYTHFKRLTRNADEDGYQDTVTVGQCAINVECLLLNAQGGKITQPHTPGEMLLGGAQLMSGYCNDAERTAMVLREIGGKTYYRTGDVAFFDRKGDYYITGRMDETIKRRGYRINLLDIDSYIHKIKGVQNCITLAYPAESIEHLLITVIIPTPGVALERHALTAAMGQDLVEYQIPDLIEFADSFPVNNSGKISRRDLMQRYQPVADAAISELQLTSKNT